MDRLKSEPKLIGVCWIAKRLGVHRNTVADWHRRKKMPAGTDVGEHRPRYIWNRELVERWAKEKGLI